MLPRDRGYRGCTGGFSLFHVDLGFECPKKSAGCTVDRPNLIVRGRVVHDAIDRQWKRLNAAMRAASRIVHPGKLKLLYVAAIDLIETAVVPGLV